MKGGLRGQVEEFSNEENMSMPQAYAQLLKYGLKHYKNVVLKERNENGEVGDETEVTEA
jgi:hypothetical protein